jgi:hypothetical protein
MLLYEGSDVGRADHSTDCHTADGECEL